MLIATVALCFFESKRNASDNSKISKILIAVIWRLAWHIGKLLYTFQIVVDYKQMEAVR